ncbi:MAG: ISKra4 family transposase [Armatimonadetes bacterium]|nr:ISKra4 family transposase [Armatimonadota bacterium]
MEETREQRIARLTDEFRKLLEEKFPKKGSTMERIEKITEEIGREITERIEDDATKQEGSGYVGSYAVCKCGCLSRYVRDYEKRIVSLHGDRKVVRAYYYCGNCKKGFCPIDETLELDGGCTTIAVRAKIARLAALVPFGRCSIELNHLCGIDVSAKTVERVAELVGSQIGKELAKETAFVLSGHAVGPKIAPNRLYVTVDGAMAPMKDGWRECKVGAVYEASPDNNGAVVARNIEHVGTFGNAEAVGDKLYALAFKRGAERCGDIVVLGDGGRWIWNQAKSNFPKATEILDFYHAAEHLSEVSKVWYGAQTPKAAKWLEERSLDLIEGRWEKVMRSIRAWRPLEAEDIKTKNDNLRYFKRNRERMRYDEYRAKEMHIGSGIAESSCKCLVQARLKQSGMRWTEAGAESILQLRRLWLDAPDTNFEQYARMAA